MYVELFGPEKQADNVPAMVHLEVRHRNTSYFRAGDNTIRKFIQPLGVVSLKFDRFTVTDQAKCRKAKQNKQNPSK